jgi:truncated hemoglobin YjbI
MLASKGKAALSQNFFEDIGGRPTLHRVHKILYKKLFAHSWLGGFFEHTIPEVVESQQNDFWAALMGGPKVYGGRSPRDAHVHMFIPAEVFDVRHELLGEALIEAGVASDLREKWLTLDANFKKALVNQSPDECQGRYRSEPIIVVPRPGVGQRARVKRLKNEWVQR